MKYEESVFVELKREVNDDLKNEIIAFLNSYTGGIIYVGVDDDGAIHNTTQKERDFDESIIINWVRDEAIYPNCSDSISISYNEDDVLTIQIESGDKKPYYVKSKGMKPSGVYVRYGRNKSQATPEEISRMYSESHEVAYESLKARDQDLTFKTLQRKFEEKDIDFNTFKMNTSGFINTKFNFYTNLAYWFSDQYNIDTKMAVYQGITRSVFRSKKEYEGSIINQIDRVMEYFELCNEVRVIIDGSPMRTEIPSYNMHAAREAILNCYCHRDYSRKSNIKIEFFDNRCEIISPGGFYGGLTLEDALNGIQSFRNENLVKLLFKLGYIENYASGLTRVFEAYENISEKPIIDNSLVAVKVTFPNVNYESFNNSVAKDDMVKGSINDSIKGGINDSIKGGINDSINDSINDGIKANSNHDKKETIILDLIKSNPKITRNEIANNLSISLRTVDRAIEILKNEGVIERVGSNKTGHWNVNSYNQ